MKECTIIVKKVYETKKTRTTTERKVVISEEALISLSLLVSECVYCNGDKSLRELFNALWED